jgi:hypothetical protein
LQVLSRKPVVCDHGQRADKSEHRNPCRAVDFRTPHCQKLANVGPEAITVIVAARANLIPVCMFFPPRSMLRSKAALQKNMLTKQRVNLVRRLRLQAGGLEGRGHRRLCPSGLRHLKTDNNPIILQVKRQGGHNGGSGRYDNQQEFARAYAFALQVLDPAVP